MRKTLFKKELSELRSGHLVWVWYYVDEKYHKAFASGPARLDRDGEYSLPGDWIIPVYTTFNGVKGLMVYVYYNTKQKRLEFLDGFASTLSTFIIT